jgi:hypothetical protein
MAFRFTRVQFLADALAVLLGGIRASKLSFTETALDSRVILALLPNRYVTELELVGVQIESADAVALASHPSLVWLSIETPDDEPDVRFPAETIRALRATWQMSGRGVSQLGGVLTLV